MIVRGSRGFGRPLYLQVVVVVVVTELVFALLIGLAVSLVSLRTAADERRGSLRLVADAVASSLMPVVADQDRARIDAQVRSIVRLPAARDITAIRVLDGTERVIAESSSSGEDMADLVANGGGSGIAVFGVFTEAQLVREPIVVEGLRVGTVEMAFEPIGLEAAFFAPLRTTALITVATVVISALWGVWLTLRHIVLPIEELRDGAERIAQGDRGVVFGMIRGDEIGQLAESLRSMTGQLSGHEERLRESYEALRSAFVVQERIMGDLADSMRARSEFVAMASHELRSPVAVVRVCSEMLEDGQYGQLEPATLDAVRSMGAAAERLGSIVSDLTDAAIADRDELSVEMGRTALLPIVRGAIHDANVLGRDRDVAVRFAGRPRAATVQGDAVRLRQVFDNILANAVRFSAPGGEVTVEVEAGSDIVEVSVEDRGRGIPQDKRQVVFEPFGRVQTGDDAEPSGLGLGLWICSQIVRAHGGDIVLRDPVEGSGCVFAVRLPTVPAKPRKVHGKAVRVT